MNLKLVTFLFFWALTVAAARKIHVVNRCDFTIWPGWWSKNGIPNGGGARLNRGQSLDIHVPDNWDAGRVWARTSCDGNFNCETGGCGNSLHCNGRTGEAGASVAEMTLGGDGGKDFYDISLVDGFNIPVVLQTSGGSGDCRPIGTDSWALLNDCPGPLQVHKNGRRVQCSSACTKFREDRYCCSGPHQFHGTCPPTDYSRYFKHRCGNCYSYAHDDESSTFTCHGANYNVLFC